MKKILKVLGILVLIFIIAIIAIPFLFEDTIKEKIRYAINAQLDAKVDFADVDLSLFRSFPQASVVIDELSIINHAPFEGDTLVYAKKIAVDMAITELTKEAEEAIDVHNISIQEANIIIKSDSIGNANFDIVKEKPETPEDQNSEESAPFTFTLDHYELTDSKLIYQNDQSKIKLVMTNVNHSGDGTVSGDHIILETQSTSEASFQLDDTNYLNKHQLQLDAVLDLDIKNQRYAFKENKALINKLPLAFTGYVQLAEAYTEIDLNFKTPNSDFKNFLAVIPETYAKNIDDVKTSGDFSIDGHIKGKVDDIHIPTIDISIVSHNASFQYPDLPKGVQNITIDTQLKNETGLVDDTYINIGNLTFSIDQDTFAVKGSLRNLTKNMLVAMAVQGKLNLANLNQAYPLQLEEKLNGIVKANVSTAFDMESIDKEQYQNVKSSGSASITDFNYASAELPNELYIKNASITLNPKTITLNQMEAKSGTSDLNAKGAIHNLMGFLFAKQDLKGDFKVDSEVFAINDFMAATTETTTETKDTTTTEEALQIPSFLDAKLDFNAKKVIYDNLTLQNTKGSVIIKDQTATLQNVTSNLFDGGIALNGNVSTKSETPTFDMALDLSKIDIVQSFSNLALLKSIAPIAKALTGALNTQLKLQGNLSDDLTPVLTSLKGNALAEILDAKVSTSNTPLLSKLNGEMKFLDVDKLNLKNVKTALNFDDGKVNVKPFTFDVEGIKITAGGNHSLDMNMNYNLTMDIPAKYMGDEVGSLLSQLNEQEMNTMTVGVPIGLTGNFSNPKIKMNTRQAVKQLTQQILQKQKKKATDQIVNKGTKALSDLLGGTKKTSDSTSTKTPESSEDKIKDAAKNILGGFLGKKKNTSK